MYNDKMTESFELKIAQIEKEIEEENSRSNINRIKARQFMFFILFGADEETRATLEQKVRDLLRNPDACEFIEITDVESSDSYNELLKQAISRASSKFVDVSDLNHFLMCPVIFSNNPIKVDVVSTLHAIGECLNNNSKEPTWQPFLIINLDDSQYDNIYKAFSDMITFIRSDTAGKNEIINRCCVLSDKDGNGFQVTLENIMQTIAMTVVLQNVASEKSVSDQAVANTVTISSNSVENNDLFFTARNAAITHPIRSITMQRMRSAIDYFSGKTDESSNDALAHINYSFINSIIKPVFDKLPTINQKITYFPLYSVMQGPDFEKRIANVAYKFYEEPLRGNEAISKQLDQAKEAFLGNFFAANGSLSYLKQLIQDGTLAKNFMDSAKNSLFSADSNEQLPDKSKLSEFNSGVYLNVRNRCKAMIDGAGTKLLTDLSTSLCDESTIAAIDKIEETFACAKEVVDERIRKLSALETVLVLDRGHTSGNSDDVQSKWIIDAAAKNPKDFSDFNKEFDSLIYKMIQQKEIADIGLMLDVCYKAVKNKDSNIEYLNKLSHECQVNEDSAVEFASAVEKNWCYTLRFMKHDEHTDITCIIGDPENRFCHVLKNRFDAALYEFKGFDRIDVLHISAPFAPDNIREWSVIEERSKAQ